MKKIIALLVIAAILSTGMAYCHKMYVGQRVNVDVYAIFDDGQPARNTDAEIYRYNETSELYELYNQTVTDSSGMVSFALPGKGTGKWKIEISSAGHKEETYLNISTDRPDATKTGIMAAAILPLAFVTWRRRSKR